MSWKRENPDPDIGKLPGKSSLAKMIFVIPIAVATVAIVSLALYFIMREYNHYKTDVNELRQDFPTQQKHELRYRFL
jgi:hypothetical protein